MQASIHSGLDLNDLADRLGIDKAYFIRLFKRTVGLPPMRYFLGLRLDTAKHRLRNGDESLRTIASDLGFHDEFHFSHQFKTHVGQSPQAFRRSLLGTF
jgi:AraC-like DNA-binding protein